MRAAVHCSVAGMSAQVPQEFVAQGGIVGGNGSAIISHRRTRGTLSVRPRASLLRVDRPCGVRYATSFVLRWLS